MPKENIVGEGQLSKEAEDFEDIFNEIVDKTDDELAELDKKKEDDNTNSDESHGDDKGDQGAGVADNQSDAKPDNTDSTDNTTDGDGQSQTATETLSESELAMKVSYLEQENEQLKADLQKEKQRTNSWDGRIKAANKKVKELESQNAKLVEQLASGKKIDSATDTNSSDDEVMTKFKEHFPELVEIIELQQRRLDEGLKKISATDKAGEDSHEETDTLDEGNSASEDTDNSAASEEDVQAKHLSDIRDAHPELDEMVGTGVLLTWIHKQGPSIKPMLLNIYNKGTAKQVIDMINNFKKQTNWKSQLEQTEQDKNDKLEALKEAEGESAGPTKEGPDKNDFAQGAKDAGLS
jgi:hypothetical protein